MAQSHGLGKLKRLVGGDNKRRTIIGGQEQNFYHVEDFFSLTITITMSHGLGNLSDQTIEDTSLNHNVTLLRPFEPFSNIQLSLTIAYESIALDK